MSDMKPEDFARGFQQAQGKPIAPDYGNMLDVICVPLQGDVAYLTCYLTVSTVSIELTKECCCFPDAAELDHFFRDYKRRGQLAPLKMQWSWQDDGSALNIDLYDMEAKRWRRCKIGVGNAKRWVNEFREKAHKMRRLNAQRAAEAASVGG